MKVLVTGATGLIGQKLCKELFKSNVELVVVGRSKEESFRKSFTIPCEYLTWRNLDRLPPIDGVIHLAGDSIASGRWTKAKKKSIIDSRVETTKALSNAFKVKGHWPEVFISATAVGFYGDRGDDVLTEESSAGNNFLAEVCKKWEDSSIDFESNSRVVKLRIGIVLSVDGGFLEPIEKIYSCGIGGPIGSGKQWMSWIHVDDLINMFIYCLNTKTISGTYNAVSPQPLTNKEWSSIYAKKLKTPNLIRTPAIVLKLVFGKKAQLALASQKVSSKKIEDSGFEFQFKSITDALDDLYPKLSNPPGAS